MPEPPFSKVAGTQSAAWKKQVFCIFFISMSITVKEIIKKTYIEAAFRRCFFNYLLLKISQNSKENARAGVLF